MHRRESEGNMTEQQKESAVTVIDSQIGLRAIGCRQGVNRRGFFHTAVAATAVAVAARRLAADERPRLSANGPPSTKIEHEFRPGDKVPVTGIYDVVHDKLDGDDHALPHQVTAIAGTKFPACRVCRTEVRFRLHHAAFHVDADVHFRG